MLLIGVEFIESLAEREYFSAKMVFNAGGAIFFSVEREHRDQKAEGISYEDDYAGNALAAMLSPGRIEVRYHRDFSDREVAEIMALLLAEARLALMAGWEVTYQGRVLRVV